MDFAVLIAISLLNIVLNVSKYIAITDQGEKNWTDANNYCSTVYGTALATFVNDDDAKQVLIAAINSSSPGKFFYVGLNDLNTYGFWEFADGTLCNNTNCINLPYWSTNEPSGGEQHCARFYISDPPNTDIYPTLDDIKCSGTVNNFFICNAPKYIAITDQGEKNWTEANNYCSTVYETALATFVNDNDAKEVFIAALNSNSPDTFFWVGLNDLNNYGFWEFADGTLCNNTNCINLSYWATNEPSGGDQHCARFYVSNPPNTDIYPTLDDIKCSTAYRNFFICNVRFTEIITSEPTTSVPTTFQPTSQPTTDGPTSHEPTTSSPTGNPITSEPTTSNPTTRNPTTTNPTTRYPTTSTPTGYPTKKPSISPSSVPTEGRSGSVETLTTLTTLTTSKVENDEDLTINVSTTDGTFNQNHVIRTVNHSLNVFLDTGYTLTADIIKPNVTINFLVDIYDEEESNIDINSTELTQKLQNDLNKDSDIIYVVDITEHVEEEKEIKDPFGFDKFNELMMAICCFLALVIIISYIDAKWCRINDYYRVTALIIAVLQFIDMIYDCLFSIKITLDPDYSIQSPLFIILLVSIAFIVIPTFITLIQLHFEMKQWKCNDVLSQWMFDNTALIYILSVICGSSFVAVRVCCSNLLNLSYFDMPLTQMQKSLFYTKRIYSSVILENVPQLMIQIIYLFISKSKTEHNDIVYASMAFSILSIVISILTILSQRNLIKSRDFVTIEFDVKGDAILSKFNQCRNRYKILRKQLSLIFGINSNMIEIRKPSQIPNGLRTHIIIHINNTKAIDLNCEKLIKDINQNGKLGKILKESWSLSGIPITGNIKYKKYDSQNRKNNTVIIKAMSQQINNNNDDDTNNNGNIVNTTIAMIEIPQMSANDTEQPGIQQPGDEYMPPIIPPIINTDFGESEGNNNNKGYNMEDSDSSEDNNTKLIVTTTDKQSVIDKGDEDVVQYINNIDNVTVGNFKQSPK